MHPQNFNQIQQQDTNLNKNKSCKTITFITRPFTIVIGPQWHSFLIALIANIILHIAVIFQLIQFISLYLYLLLSISQILFFITTAMTDPGYIHKDQKQSIKQCYQCSLKVSRGTIHCFICGRCVKQYDHHCPWVGKCIGKGNIISFKIFCSLAISTFLAAIVLVII